MLLQRYTMSIVSFHEWAEALVHLTRINMLTLLIYSWPFFCDTGLSQVG